jgi:hypothetical protein
MNTAFNPFEIMQRAFHEAIRDYQTITHWALNHQASPAWTTAWTFERGRYYARFATCGNCCGNKHRRDQNRRLTNGGFPPMVTPTGLEPVFSP